MTEDGEDNDTSIGRYLNDTSIESPPPPPEYLDALARLKKLRDTWEVGSEDYETKRVEFQAKFDFSIEQFDAEIERLGKSMEGRTVSEEPDSMDDNPLADMGWLPALLSKEDSRFFVSSPPNKFYY